MRYSTYFKAVAAVSAPLLLAACGGGSGGPGGPGGPLDPGGSGGTTKPDFSNAASFTSFNEMKPSETTSFAGIFREGNLTSTANNSIYVTLDKDGNIAEVNVNNPIKGTYSIGGSTIETTKMAGIIKSVADDNSSSIMLADPAAKGFEYQTYGLWETSTGVGMATLGNSIDVANIPTSGNATFKGSAIAKWNSVDGTAQDYMTADTTLDADFANNSASFSTTNSTLVDGGANPNLDMTGTLSYQPGDKILSGTVATAGGMDGKINGRFYGSNAEEVGGFFELEGQGSESLSGSFGVVRQ